MTNALLPNADGNVKRPVFCASCGSAGDGAFCRLCGAPLHGSEPRQVERATLQGSQAAYAASQPASGRENDGLRPDYVRVAAVARQATEYIDIEGLGVVKLASIGQRVLARILDFAVVGVGYWVIIGIFTAVGAIIGSMSVGDSSSYGYSDSYDSQMGQAGGFLGGVLLGFFFAAVLAYTYEVAMTALWGRTVGKMVVGARVVRSVDGKRPNIGNAFLRWLAPGLGALIPFLGGLGALLVLLSPTFDASGRRQGWHDKMASTLVIEAPRSISKQTGVMLVESAKSAAGSLRDSVRSQ